ncbi:hypothetical protein H4R34_001657 [Dimargaris verticillata]|uniref:Mediator of RNA polymerase II transcription subunit 4 n=1 Tax=Dimargaris verticillata TaxID=2761393 RepID=A0A9W8EEA4_9FUNG|nr:hypothetical protein H4R34_001657 [Dimargaris verticillata]
MPEPTASTSANRPTTTRPEGLQATSIPIQDKLTDILRQFRICTCQLLDASQQSWQDISPSSILRFGSLLPNDEADATTTKQPLALVQKLLDLDAQLKLALKEVEYHQGLQQQIGQVQQSVKEQDQNILDLVAKLMSSKEKLETFIRLAEKQKSAMEQAQKHMVTFSDVVPYASRLSNYTAAPPNFDPANAAGHFEPPYPSEVTMRSGLLNQKRHIAAPTTADSKETVPKLHIDSELMSSFMANHQHDAEADESLLDLDLNPDLM